MAKKKTSEPTIVRPNDIDPQHRWDRPLQAPGHTQVDFEERVNFRRLHDYRLARTRAALDVDGIRTVLQLRSKFGIPQKTLNDPMKYVDLSYYEKAFKR